MKWLDRIRQGLGDIVEVARAEREQQDLAVRIGIERGRMLDRDRRPERGNRGRLGRVA